MKVLFRSRDPEGARMRELAVRRVRFVLRRFTWLVPRAIVSLSDGTGPGGATVTKAALCSVPSSSMRRTGDTPAGTRRTGASAWVR